MITISLKQILAKRPCANGWAKVLHSRNKISDGQLSDCLELDEVPLSYSKLADDEQFNLADLLVSNDYDDLLWALKCVPSTFPLWRKFAVWSARQVQHLMTDQRSIIALDTAWKHSEGLATDRELSDARAAASCAASYAASDAASYAASCAASYAASCASYAASDAASYASYAASYAASDAARALQIKKIKEIIEAGHWVD